MIKSSIINPGNRSKAGINFLQTISNKTLVYFFAIQAVFFLCSFSTVFSQKLDVKTPEQTTRKVLDLYNHGKYTEITDFFDARLKKGLSPQKLENSWEGITSQVGSYQGIEEVRAEPYVGSIIITCICRFGNKLVDFKCDYNGAQQITSLYFLPHNYVPPEPPDSLKK